MITSISLPDSNLLLSELIKLDPELKPHYPEGRLRDIAALRDITSVFLATNIFPLSGKMLENPIRHNAINLLNSPAKLLGKTSDDIHYAYYANIPPMTQIYPHVDVAPYYNKVNRYQIFFDLTKDGVPPPKYTDINFLSNIYSFDASKSVKIASIRDSSSPSFLLVSILKSQ